jgi:hypothetical protein
MLERDEELTPAPGQQPGEKARCGYAQKTGVPLQPAGSTPAGGRDLVE